jgi:hypothetical protein
MQNKSPAAKLTVEVPVQLAGGGTWKDARWGRGPNHHHLCSMATLTRH